jgi:hypothetical protein
MVSHLEMNKRLDFDFSELYLSITFLVSRGLWNIIKQLYIKITIRDYLLEVIALIWYLHLILFKKQN